MGFRRMFEMRARLREICSNDNVKDLVKRIICWMAFGSIMYFTHTHFDIQYVKDATYEGMISKLWNVAAVFGLIFGVLSVVAGDLEGFVANRYWRSVLHLLTAMLGYPYKMLLGTCLDIGSFSIGVVVASFIDGLLNYSIPMSEFVKFITVFSVILSVYYINLLPLLTMAIGDRVTLRFYNLPMLHRFGLYVVSLSTLVLSLRYA